MKKIDNAEFRYEPSIMFAADDTYLMAREPVLRRMPDGSLFSLIYTGGPCEPHPENLVAAVRSTDDGKSWSYPQELFKHPRRSCWGTELFTGGDQPFMIFQTFDTPSYYQELRAYVSTTSVNGLSWSEPQTLPGVPVNFSVRQGRVLSDGSWLFPVYWQEVRSSWRNILDWGKFNPRSTWFFVSGVIRSTDRGRSWSLHGSCSTGATLSAWEPEVIEVAPGKLRMFIRCESPEHCLWEAESSDYGVHWTEPVPGPVSNPGTKFTIYKVRDQWVMLNNLCGKDGAGATRNVLSLLTSPDGRNWKEKFEIARVTRRTPDSPFEPLPQMSYPHGFADDKEQALYLALDAIRKFFFVKIPYADILK